MATKTANAGVTRLIVSDDKSPAVRLKKGMRIEVREVVFNTPNLEKVSQAARLCGMGGACMALIDLAGPVISPAPKTAAPKTAAKKSAAKKTR